MSTTGGAERNCTIVVRDRQCSRIGTEILRGDVKRVFHFSLATPGQHNSAVHATARRRFRNITHTQSRFFTVLRIDVHFDFPRNPQTKPTDHCRPAVKNRHEGTQRPFSDLLGENRPHFRRPYLHVPPARLNNGTLITVFSRCRKIRRIAFCARGGTPRQSSLTSRSGCERQTRDGGCIVTHVVR